MTRRVVYGIGLWIAIAATAMTLASIIEPRWLSYSPDGTGIQYSYGLHRRCSSVTGTCDDFPQYEDCAGHNRPFCSMWRTIGFLMSFTVIIELATLIAYVTIILGGKQRRDKGWKIMTALLFVAGLCQLVSMAIVAFLFDNDNRFFEGWYLDVSWILCTVSWIILSLSGCGLVASAIYLPEEGDYEFITG